MKKLVLVMLTFLNFNLLAKGYEGGYIDGKWYAFYNNTYLERGCIQEELNEHGKCPYNLDVYIDENNRVRQAMINELDWEMNDMVGLVSQIFRRSRSYVSSNKILTEWYNPLISDELHKYYSSEEGKVANPFHQFLVETFTNRMVEEGYSQKKIQEILQVYNLFYYMDMHITENDFSGVSKTVEILATYFIKGIFK